MAKELWDAYDKEGTPLGFDLVRGEPVPEGVYHLVVEVLAVTNDGRVLLTKRHPDKAWGGCWNACGGRAAGTAGGDGDRRICPGPASGLREYLAGNRRDGRGLLHLSQLCDILRPVKADHPPPGGRNDGLQIALLRGIQRVPAGAEPRPAAPVPGPLPDPAPPPRTPSAPSAGR